MRVQAHGRPSMKLEHQEIPADRRHALGVTRVSSVASGARCAVMSVWCSGRAVDPARQPGSEDIEILIPGDPEACTMVIALDRAYFERKAREVLGGEAVTTAEIPPRVERYAAAADPLMREIGNALRSEVHSRRRPNAAYLECMAAMVAIHLAKTYCGGAPALPRAHAPSRPRRSSCRHRTTASSRENRVSLVKAPGRQCAPAGSELWR